jgi:serine/threonine protein kinase
LTWYADDLSLSPFQGLSLSKDDALSPGVSGFQHGTKSHMAPEILADGYNSTSTDVYSFGILLYELYTGVDAFCNTPDRFLDQMVIHDHHRPIFPPGTPKGYHSLALACWSHDASLRPSFEAIVASLARFREEEGGPTDRVDLTESALQLAASTSSIGDIISIMPATSLRPGLLRAPSTKARIPDTTNAAQTQPRPELTPDQKEFWVAYFNY